MAIHSIGIIGYGAFGTHMVELIQRFAPNVVVKVASRRYEPDGRLFFPEAEVCACDAVVLCCSIRDFEAELERLLPLIPETTVIVDVATVKTHTVKIFQKYAGGRQYLATHPMFGPESYKKTTGDVSGYRIVVAGHTLSSETYTSLVAFVKACGFVIIEMTPDEHDKLLADTLFLTHYIGQTMKHAGFLRTDIDTVSFQSLMNAVESVAHDEQLFMDVYRYNPYCNDAAERFHAAQEEVLAKLKSQTEG
ncbi:MAG: prephenate dehydrogenase/arogenate dehydrogenase family protein [Candidatus Paceibacterota bacterium]